MFFFGWLFEIEQEGFGFRSGSECERSALFRARTITSRQRDTVQRQPAFSNLQPSAMTRFEIVSDGLPRFEPNAIDVHVLMNCCRALPTIGGDHQYFRG